MEQQLTELAAQCRHASRVIAGLDSGLKQQLLETISQTLLEDTDNILAANQLDLKAAREKGLPDAMVDRLVLNEGRLQSIADAVREVAGLPDPVGEVSRQWLRPNGIRVGRQRIPLGVIAMIYESRPNVTVDAAVLCLAAGNSIILRGGSEAFHSNTALATTLQKALAAHNLPGDAVVLVPTTDRAAMNTLLTLDQYIDLVIPRGGEGLIRFVAENSRIPVIKHYKGVCHLYVDKDADTEKARNLLLDGKTSRPGVCNALETMLVHAEIAETFLPQAGADLAAKGVVIKGCQKTCQILPEAKPATDADYAEEFLDLVIAVKVVDNYDEAIGHIHEFASDHTEVIVTQNISTANSFVRDINSSVVMVNASSRFSDGGQLGLGAEIGISTTKLHAYGPMGLEALTTEKFVVFGEGQTRH